MTLFGSKQPSVTIEKVENIEVSFPFHPFYEEILMHYLKRAPYPDRPPFFPFEIPTGKPPEEEKSIWTKRLNSLSTLVSIISGIAVIVFVILLYTGTATIGSLNVGNLLAIFSFTMFGGLISVGGVKMFSITANLRKAQQQLQRVMTSSGGCPYVAVVDEETKQKYSIKSAFEIGSKDFCSRCQLVDHNGRTVCRVSPYYRN